MLRQYPPQIQEALEGCTHVIGSDECGYGCWAGPLMVCAAVMRVNSPLEDLVMDSKTYHNRKAREAAYQHVEDLPYALVVTHPEEIDDLGVYTAVQLAHKKAVEQARTMLLSGEKAVAIVDGNLNIPGAISLVSADKWVPAVSAASIIAKVHFDKHMALEDKRFPGYGFAKHCGYGTLAHRAALQKLGPCAIHRKSYGPVAAMLSVSDAPQNMWEALDE